MLKVQRSKWTSRRAAIAELLNEIPMEPQAAQRQIRRRPPRVQRVRRECQRRKIAPALPSQLRHLATLGGKLGTEYKKRAAWPLSFVLEALVFFAPQFRVCSSRQCDYSRCRPRVDGRATAPDTVKKCCYTSTAATAPFAHMRTGGTAPAFISTSQVHRIVGRLKFVGRRIPR